jgi:hypothetical protein
VPVGASLLSRIISDQEVIGPEIAMQLLAFREYPAIDARTLVECKGHERLFRAADGSFLLHMSSEGQPVVEERVMWLSVRDAMSWLNEEPDQYGSLWEFAEAVPAAATRAALRIL